MDFGIRSRIIIKLLKQKFEVEGDADRLKQVILLLADYNNEKVNKRLGISNQSLNPVIVRINRSILELTDELN